MHTLRRQLRTPAYLSALSLLVAFVVLACMYSVITPPWEAPDEVGHFQYVAHLLRTHSLPMQRLGELGEAHQPPLYYAMAAVGAIPADLNDPTGTFRLNPHFMWAGEDGNEVNASFHDSAETFPFRGQALALHLVRGVSVLMGLMTVGLTIAIGWEIFPNRRSIGLLAGALVAFNPQFLFISGSVNNDNLVTMAATGAWWQILRTLKRSEQWRQWVYAGMWIAVGILAKLAGLVIGVVAGLVLLACAAQRRSLKLLVHGALAMTLVAVLITGWWFAHNQVRYGDPFGWTVYQQVFEVNLRHSPLQWADLREFFSVQFRSFWGVFGWMNVSAPSWFYGAARVLCLVSLSGLGLSAIQGRFSKLSGFQNAALALLGLIVLAQEMYMIAVITRCDASCYQGRYLFPIIGPLMVIAGLGLVSLMPRRLTPLLTAGLMLALVGTAIFMPLKVIKPAYQIVPLPKWNLWFVANKTEFTFGDMFELKGYKVQTDTDSSQVILTLYWQAMQRPDFDYSVFTHIIDESNQLIAQKDHAPGDNVDYLPTAWWPGDIIADEHIIETPPQLASGTYRFRVGVYDWATGEQLPVLWKDEPIGSFVILDQELHR